MLKLVLDETIHDDGSGNANEDSPAGQASVYDDGLCIHLFSLLAVGERGEARTDEGVKE